MWVYSLSAAMLYVFIRPMQIQAQCNNVSVTGTREKIKICTFSLAFFFSLLSCSYQHLNTFYIQE